MFDKPHFTITRDWITAAGLRAVATRTGNKKEELSWPCGYVGVRSDHPLHGRDINQLENIDIHGDITYGSNNHPIHSSTLWWLGFDCAHPEDMPQFGGTAKSDDFVYAECERLAVQLAQLRSEPSP